MAYGVNKLDVSWARKHFPENMSWSDIIQAVEDEAVKILVSEEEDGDAVWATEYFATTRDEAHAGDCGECRIWLRAPISCDACIYDEYMAKAWEKLKKEYREP